MTGIDFSTVQVVVGAVVAIIGAVIGWAAFQQKSKAAMAILEDVACIFGDIQKLIEYVRTFIGPVSQGQPPILPTQEQWNQIVTTTTEIYNNMLDIEKNLQSTIGIDRCNKLMKK